MNLHNERKFAQIEAHLSLAYVAADEIDDYTIRRATAEAIFKASEEVDRIKEDDRDDLVVHREGTPKMVDTMKKGEGDSTS